MPSVGWGLQGAADRPQGLLGRKVVPSISALIPHTHTSFLSSIHCGLRATAMQPFLITVGTGAECLLHFYPGAVGTESRTPERALVPSDTAEVSG
jgi:hypothetical protein